MRCGQVDELLGAYVLKALPDREGSIVEEHLASCARHASALQEMARSTSLLTPLAKPREPPPKLRNRVLSAIRAGSATPTVSLGWRSESLPVGSHVCAFHSGDEQLKEMMGFIRTGLDEAATFGVVFGDRGRFNTLLGWLRDGYNGPLDSLLKRGKMALIEAAPRVEQLEEQIGERLDRAMREGYDTIRFLGFIGWNQPGWPDLDALVEFESKVNQVVRAYPAVIVCTYDMLRLPGLSLVRGGLQQHPITVLGTQLLENNPYYQAA